MKVIQIKNIFPHVKISRFNLAAWQRPDNDSIYFIGREVAEPGKHGEPDSGILKLFEVDSNGEVVQERAIWEPMYDSINLEDPRALELTGESLIIGLTAVLWNKKGQPLPFPAIVKINSHATWNQKLPPFLVIETFGPGKNLTPIDGSTYLFRPDGADYHHKILVFSLHKQVPEKLADIEFPTNLAWAKWRIGTTISPIWLSETEALFIVHGITIQKVDGVDKYIYSIGRARLLRKDNNFTVQVAEEPILTPDSFLNKDGTPMVQELHPDLRRVVYSCGGLINKGREDFLSLYVNVGDRATYEVQFSLNELKEGLF
jgi:predicted GH43/DUF377 family glycosyl hydrolase